MCKSSISPRYKEPLALMQSYLGCAKLTSQVPVETCEYKDSGLYEGNDYQYRVCAVNQAGNGPPSTGSDIFKAQNPIDGLSLFVLSRNVF